MAADGDVAHKMAEYKAGEKSNLRRIVEDWVNIYEEVSVLCTRK